MKYLNEIYKFFLFFMLFGLYSSALYSQSSLNKQYLSNDIEKLLNSKPDQALKIAQHLLSKTNITNNEKANINFLIAKTYKVKGDYSSALNFLYEEKSYEPYLSDEEKIAIELEKINLLRELSLDKQANEALLNLEENFSSISEERLKKYLKAAITLEKVKFLLNENQIEKGQILLDNQDIFSINVFKKNPELYLDYQIILAKLHVEKKEYNKAKILFEEVLSKATNQKDCPIFFKIDALLGLANIYFIDQKNSKVSLLLNDAVKSTQDFDNVFFKEKILEQQIINNLALNDTSNYKLINTSFIQNQLKSEIVEQEAINTAYNVVTEGYNDIFLEKKESYFRVLYIMLGLLFIILLGCLFYWWKIFQSKVQLKEIIKYIEITTSNFTSQVSQKKQDTKKNIILKETEELLLNKLKRFENSKRFNNKDISLSVLAGQFDTNTKYLSEVINSHYNMNFNLYINRLRINYIVEKLKTDPNFMNYKISYLAENCGFSSHSSFATVFKSITGISPVTFIELLNNENENKLVS
jgi:AraC-like DNA-binding protein